MLRSTLPAAVFLLVIADASSARAEPAHQPTARLDCQRNKGAEQCPGEGELRAYVAARLGRDPFEREFAEDPPRISAERLRALVQRPLAANR